MSSNRITITFGTTWLVKGATLKCKTQLNPNCLEKATNELSEELKSLANDKERIRLLLELFAENSWNEYLKSHGEIL